MLKEHGLTSYKLKKMEKPIMSQSTYTSLMAGRGGVDHNTINRLCAYFKCQPGDIMEYVED